MKKVILFIIALLLLIFLTLAFVYIAAFSFIGTITHVTDSDHPQYIVAIDNGDWYETASGNRVRIYWRKGGFNFGDRVFALTGGSREDSDPPGVGAQFVFVIDRASG